MNLNFIKTPADALAAIDAIALPVVGEKASDAQKEFAARESALVAAAKDFMKARITALPADVKVIGVELRAETGDLELFQFRIINHK